MKIQIMAWKKISDTADFRIDIMNDNGESMQDMVKTILDALRGVQGEKIENV